MSHTREQISIAYKRGFVDGQLRAAEMLGTKQVQLQPGRSCLHQGKDVYSVDDAVNELPHHRHCTCAWAPYKPTPFSQEIPVKEETK